MREIVGAVQRADKAAEAPDVALAWQSFAELRGIVGPGVPTDECYDQRLVHYQKQCPKASAALLEHLPALEG